jgi:HSP20 family protein
VVRIEIGIVELQLTGRHLLYPADPSGLAGSMPGGIDDFLSGRVLKTRGGLYLRHTWSPAIDVYETAEAFIVVAELAGVAPDELTIELDADRQTLRLRGTRRGRPAAPASSPGSEVQRGRVVPHLIEIAVGAFERSVVLPGPADAGGAEASGHHGMYEVYLPKAAPPRARRLRVAGVAEEGPAVGARFASLGVSAGMGDLGDLGDLGEVDVMDDEADVARNRTKDVEGRPER